MGGATHLLPTYNFAAETGTTYIKYHCEALPKRNSNTVNTKHQVQNITLTQISHIIKKLIYKFGLGSSSALCPLETLQPVWLTPEVYFTITPYF
jgi:hypothetical protein